MNDSGHLFAVFAAVAAGAGLLVYSIAVLRDKRRTAALQVVAQELGFTYRHDGQPFDPSPVPEVSLFNKGRDRRFRHVLNGWVAGRQAAVFDYQFTVGSGKNSRTLRQTVAAYRLPHAIANFELSPRNWGAKVSAFFGGQDIHFADQPEFSKRYRLQGRDEISIRQFFTSPVLLYFEQLPPHPWHVETSEGWLIIFHEGHRIPPDGISDFIQAASTFAAGLQQL